MLTPSSWVDEEGKEGQSMSRRFAITVVGVFGLALLFGLMGTMQAAADRPFGKTLVLYSKVLTFPPAGASIWDAQFGLDTVDVSDFEKIRIDVSIIGGDCLDTSRTAGWRMVAGPEKVIVMANNINSGCGGQSIGGVEVPGTQLEIRGMSGTSEPVLVRFVILGR